MADPCPGRDGLPEADAQGRPRDYRQEVEGLSSAYGSYRDVFGPQVRCIQPKRPQVSVRGTFSTPFRIPRSGTVVNERALLFSRG